MGALTRVVAAACAFAAALARGARLSKGPTRGRTGAAAAACPARTAGRACPTLPAIGSTVKACRTKGRALGASGHLMPLSGSQVTGVPRAAGGPTPRAVNATSAPAPSGTGGLGFSRAAIVAGAAARGLAVSRSTATTRATIAAPRPDGGPSRGRGASRAGLAACLRTSTNTHATTQGPLAACL